jgi:large subunit ribosomal protein L11
VVEEQLLHYAHRPKEENMAKKVAKICKLNFLAGQAKPGPALASAGINMPQFCSQFNDATKDRHGDIVPVVITAYEDKSFDFVLKTTPAAFLLRKAAGVEKGSGTPNSVKAGKITKAQLQEIAEYKMPDLNANDVEAAMRIIAGTARNMGIEVEE